jgi:hypothetical protein
MMTPQEEAQAVLRPMIDLFGGADGGVGFAKLCHDFLPEMIKLRPENPQADEFVKMMYRLSRLCELMMEKQ